MQPHTISEEEIPYGVWTFDIRSDCHKIGVIPSKRIVKESYVSSQLKIAPKYAKCHKRLIVAKGKVEEE